VVTLDYSSETIINNTADRIFELEDAVNDLRNDNIALMKAKDVLSSENNWLKKSYSDLHATLYETKVATLAMFAFLMQESLQMKTQHGVVVSKRIDENTGPGGKQCCNERHSN
jgi:hypothetical protein